jgi:hypothetical protein
VTGRDGKSLVAEAIGQAKRCVSLLQFFDYVVTTTVQHQRAITAFSNLTIAACVGALVVLIERPPLSGSDPSYGRSVS